MNMDQHLSDEQLIAIADEYGSPVYVYNADKIAKQYYQLTTAFTGMDVRFFYASKALTNPSILKHLYAQGAGIDCSSINEVKMALFAGAKPADILYTSNGIAFDEIAEAVSLGVHVNIDSISNLEKFGKAYGHSYPVGLRLRPNIMAGGNLKISTGHDKSKFGIPVDQMEEVLAVVNKHNVFVQGLHIHTGSEIKDVEVFVKGIEVLFDIVPLFQELSFIDLGGGFKVPYKKGDAQTDINLLAQKVQEAFAIHPNPNGKPLQVWLEPGKCLVSECGYVVTQVNVMKDTSDDTFEDLNSGINHLIRPMFYDSYHYIKNISNPDGEPKHYAVVGNICETDTFAWDRKLAEVREGDYLAFFNAGAYGFEMSSNFNSRYKPAEVMVLHGAPMLIRTQDTFENWIRNIIGPG